MDRTITHNNLNKNALNSNFDWDNSKNIDNSRLNKSY